MIRFAILLAVAVTVPIHAQRNRQPTVSAEALKVMQTHEVKAIIDRTFSAVVGALVDRNYSIDSANKEAGLITATENTKSKMSGLGMATRQNTIKLSIILSSLDSDRTRIRVNAIDNYLYTYHGKTYRDENTQVSIASIYADLFSAIEQALG